MDPYKSVRKYIKTTGGKRFLGAFALVTIIAIYTPIDDMFRVAFGTVAFIAGVHAQIAAMFAYYGVMISLVLYLYRVFTKK